MTPQRARVELRSPTAADRDEFLAAMRASRKLHRPWLQSAITPEAYDDLLVRAEDERYDPLLVCLRDDGPIIGYMNISQIVRGSFQSAFLGYGAVAAYAGQGYMSEGLQLVLARAFTQLEAPPSRGEHPAGQHRVDRAGEESRVRPRGIRRALPEDQRPVARPRALGDPGRAVARAQPPADPIAIHAPGPRISSTTSPAPPGWSGSPVISRR